ncbi:helix-turn-helix domain-containing protein [Chryseobacterium sp. PTM-20240506]|uniref:helix-turn-helix domain-containing protein n=1 Tax=unclassified Chryseobacterium TaxID=2593645 RepID=UPI0023590166|nr:MULTISPECIES: helix-turn-helix transcriptional regulator [unclassified Chryseobacterium]MDC8104085.1 helix-turn-helix transcriptional regulator [Chryseobacterium sp. B21-037]MDQ1803693.1 helix-turn-helix transcriptional regulator [Chryseobacterium sp. CKR4-1]WBV57624.1 helix-turn-helix transcriptional regulator [Chryseobacterium daecheongense]
MKTPEKVSSITAMHHYLKLKKPTNPLISVFDFNEVSVSPDTILSAITTEFYVIAIKSDCAGRFKYGQQYYDFEDGIMYFIAPHQVVQFEDILLSDVKGSVLVIHPDFLQGYPIASSIKDYGYFSYSANEALHLSEKEENSVTEIIANIRRETENNMDVFTQDLLISNIDLLLKYCDRFYNRQFLTRKKVNNDLLTQLETLLDEQFKNNSLIINGIPSVQFIANELHISPNYLSDMLRVHTGQTTQQHIQNRLIAKAKELLSTTSMSVSEIAYHLGFEHSQSFHRLFKNRTSLSPLEFRQTFN